MDVAAFVLAILLDSPDTWMTDFATNARRCECPFSFHLVLSKARFHFHVCENCLRYQWDEFNVCAYRNMKGAATYPFLNEDEHGMAYL